jgi:hypothetical protein
LTGRPRSCAAVTNPGQLTMRSAVEHTRVIAVLCIFIEGETIDLTRTR